MVPLLPTLTPTRRRVLGSAAMTLLAARLGTTGSARAMTTKETTMTTATTARYTAQDTAAADIRPFQVEVPQADLDDLRQRLAATRLPSKELVADRSQGVQLATIQELTRYWATDHDWRKTEATAQCAAPVHDRDRRGRHPLHPCQVASTRTPCR